MKNSVSSALPWWKVVWGLFWRTWVLTAIVFSIIPFLPGLHFILPSAGFMALSLLLLLVHKLFGKSCIAFLWGDRLLLTKQQWSYATISTSVFLCALAAFNLIVAFFAPLEIWIKFKFYILPTLMVAFYLWLGNKAIRNNQTPSILRSDNFANQKHV